MKQVIIFSMLFFLWASIGQAQNLRVTQFQFATSVEKRAPVNVDTAFSANVGNVFCFTQIQGAEDTAEIAHVWYYKDEEKARINLDVKSNDWRTWSSKSILKSWTGPWRVMIEDSNGNVLKTKSFTIYKN